MAIVGCICLDRVSSGLFRLVWKTCPERTALRILVDSPIQLAISCQLTVSSLPTPCFYDVFPCGAVRSANCTINNNRTGILQKVVSPKATGIAPSTVVEKAVKGALRHWLKTMPRSRARERYRNIRRILRAILKLRQRKSCGSLLCGCNYIVLPGRCNGI